MDQKNLLEKITQQPITTIEVTPDIAIIQQPFVNVILVGNPNAQNKEWVIIGAGMAHTGKAIIQAAEKRFGQVKPTAIILTHAHFDHVGGIVELIQHWNVPVYAHQAELPYLTGQQDYPPADPAVSEGLIAQISPTFPHQGINLGNKVQALPADHGVPGMLGWRWLHTPGHCPGHVSLFRDSDRVLIVGDAFTTLNQNCAESVLSKEKKLFGPPAYFTMDWEAAKRSVQKLQALNPALAISSHGLPMQGAELTVELNNLAFNFDEVALPEHGKYVPV